MKTLISIFAVVLLPVLAMAQDHNIPSIPLKTLDDRTVQAPGIIHNNGLTLVYFFNDQAKDLADNLEYLENLANEHNYPDKVKVIAIYNPSNGNYLQLKPFLDGNAINVETYIDVNGDLQRAMGLSSNSSVILFGNEKEYSTRYSESLEYTDVILDSKVSQLIGDHFSGNQEKQILGNYPAGN